MKTIKKNDEMKEMNKKVQTERHESFIKWNNKRIRLMYQYVNYG